jgi:predicted nucleic acid-binding protein
MLPAIADTGPLVAFLDRSERHHSWVAARIGELQVPLLVCEPVLMEAMHLLARLPRAQDTLFGLIERGALSIGFHMDENVSALRRLHQKYRDRPMSLADACVVRMAEIYDRHVVFTLDSDFSVYRKHSRLPIALIHPAGNTGPKGSSETRS